MMTKSKINPLVLIGLVGILTIGTNFAVQLYRACRGNQDIWWTPRTMQLPLKETRDNFRLFISGKPLDQHLEEQTLYALDQEGKKYRIVTQDISVRVNNWNKVRASILSNALVSSVAFGVVLTLLVTGLVQVWGQKRRVQKTG